MAVPAGPIEKRYTGNGVTTIFTIPFLLLAASDLEIYLNGTQVLTGFTLTGVGNPTSTITFSVAPPNLSALVLQLNVPFERLNDYQENGDFLSSTVNRDFDRIWQALKQLLRLSTRALTLGVYDLDGAGSYRAKFNRISSLADPVDPQDAATAHWTQLYLSSLVSAGQGPLNVAANVLYVGPDGLTYRVQDMSSALGAGLHGYAAGNAYPPNTIGAAIQAIGVPGLPGYLKEQRTSIDFDLLGNVGNVVRLNAAIKSGTVRVAFAGDSIVQGDADGLYDNSTAGIIMRTLVEQNKNVNFVFANYSIAGLGIHSFSDLNYKGMTYPADPYIGFFRSPGNEFNNQWPGGSVIGKAWIDHVKDFVPDLVFVMFGANDIGEDSLTLEAHNKAAIDYMATWTNPPSIALATAALPASTYGYQDEVQRAANVVRDVAHERGHSLIDINRLFNSYRYGRDVCSQLYLKDNGFDGYPTGWTPDPGTTFALDVTPGTILGQGVTIRNKSSRDINISADMVAVNWSTTTMGIRYGSLGTGTSYYSAFVTGGALFLYWGPTLITSQVISPAIPNGTTINIMVNRRGAKHQVFLNGLKKIDVLHYGNLLAGTHGYVCNGGVGAILNSVVHLANYSDVGIKKFSDVDIYGYSTEEFASNPNSLGGNGINHPTQLGNKEIWAHAFTPILQHIKSAQNIQTGNYNCALNLSGNQTITTAASTAISWTAEQYDADGMHVANSSTVTIPAAGKYLVAATVYWQANATGTRSCLLQKNGVEVAGDTRGASPSGRVRQNISVELLLAKGDTLVLFGFQDSGASLTVDLDGSRMSVRSLPV